MTPEDLPGTAHVLADQRAVADTVAEWIAAAAQSAGLFRFMASGGHTPRLLYETLARPPLRDRIDWTRWEVFYGDERAVPPDSPASNHRMVDEALLSRVPIPADRVHRIPAERPDLDAVTAEYGALLEQRAGAPPTVDVVLLGLGPDGHTASLFPGTPALAVRNAWTARGMAPEPPVDRVGVTFATINAARHVAFLVTGAEKGTALRGVVGGTVPAAAVNPATGSLRWYIDAAAAQAMA